MERQLILITIRNGHSSFFIISVYLVAIRRIYNIEGNILSQALGKLGNVACKMLCDVYVCPSGKSVLLYHGSLYCRKDLCLSSLLGQGQFYGCLCILFESSGTNLIFNSFKYNVYSYVVHSHIELNCGRIEYQGVSYGSRGTLEIATQIFNQNVQSHVFSGGKIISYESLALGLPSAVCKIRFQSTFFQNNQISCVCIGLITGNCRNGGNEDIQGVAQSAITKESRNHICSTIQRTVITGQSIQTIVGITKFSLNSIKVIYQIFNLRRSSGILIGNNGKIKLSIVSIQLSQKLVCGLNLIVFDALIFRKHIRRELHTNLSRSVSNLYAVRISIFNEQLKCALLGSIGVFRIFGKILSCIVHKLLYCTHCLAVGIQKLIQHLHVFFKICGGVKQKLLQVSIYLALNRVLHLNGESSGIGSIRRFIIAELDSLNNRVVYNHLSVYRIPNESFGSFERPCRYSLIVGIDGYQIIRCSRNLVAVGITHEKSRGKQLLFCFGQVIVVSYDLAVGHLSFSFFAFFCRSAEHQQR